MASSTVTTPVIAGAGQVIQRPGDVDLADARGTIELMADAARTAAADAGASGLLSKVGWIGVAGGWYPHRNPGQLVGALIGADSPVSVRSAISGTGPQDLLGAACRAVAEGSVEVALVVGGEAMWSQQRLKRAGEEPRWITDPGEGDPEKLGHFPQELRDEAMFLGGAPMSYAVFEDALRVAAGHDLDTHRDLIAGLWAGFSAVAATNPYAWDQVARSAAEIRDPGPDNRMISFPYTKALVANNTVDLGSALLVCSAEAAAAAGVARDRMVFPQVIVGCHETWLVANRDRLDRARALEAAAAVVHERLGLGADDYEHVDLYSCFPSIVQISSHVFGFGERPLTVTGGLGFAGAAVGNAVGHAMAAMVDRVRGGGRGLIHGNGGVATKHSVGVYDTEPPADGFAWIDCQDRIDHGERPALAADREGPVTIEAATVVYDREGPAHVLAAVLDDAGARGWVKVPAAGADGFGVDGAAVAAEVEQTGIAGRRAHRRADATFTLV